MRFTPHVKFETMLAREVETALDTAVIEYDVVVEASVDGPEGDGWNEPALGPGADVGSQVPVVATRVWFDDELVDTAKFEGPLPCAFVRPGGWLTLAPGERDQLEAEAVREAVDQEGPDPDLEYEKWREEGWI